MHIVSKKLYEEGRGLAVTARYAQIGYADGVGTEANETTSANYQLNSTDSCRSTVKIQLGR